MTKPNIDRQGKQLVHVIGLLTRCLEISHRSASLRTEWERDLLTAKQDLEALHAGGLRRDFIAPAARGGARRVEPAAPVPVPHVPKAAPREATGLEPWQRELMLRLERGLGRPLKPRDGECIAWNLVAGTMSVIARPLLGELRENNLTSNVFRRRSAGSTARLNGVAE